MYNVLLFVNGGWMVDQRQVGYIDFTESITEAISQHCVHLFLTQQRTIDMTLLVHTVQILIQGNAQKLQIPSDIYLLYYRIIVHKATYICSNSRIIVLQYHAICLEIYACNELVYFILSFKLYLTGSKIKMSNCCQILLYST